MKEWIKENFLWLLITLALIVGAIFVIGLGIYVDKKNADYHNSEEYKQLLIQQENCEHEWVTVSRGSGRTLSVYTKCIKCGKEVH